MTRGSFFVRLPLTLFQTLAVAAVCCLTVGQAHAGTVTVPWLSGYFSSFDDGESGYPWGVGISTLDDYQHYLYIGAPFGDPAAFCDPVPTGSCGYTYSGTQAGYLGLESVDSVTGQEITFTAYVVDTYSGQSTGMVYNTYTGDYVIEVTQTDDLKFSGRWSNGFRSTGEISGSYDVGGDTSGGGVVNNFIDGFMNTTSTPTPEPGSILLLGSGVVGLAGLFRRRFLS